MMLVVPVLVVILLNTTIHKTFVVNSISVVLYFTKVEK